MREKKNCFINNLSSADTESESQQQQQPIQKQENNNSFYSSSQTEKFPNGIGNIGGNTSVEDVPDLSPVKKMKNGDIEDRKTKVKMQYISIIGTHSIHYLSQKIKFFNQLINFAIIFSLYTEIFKREENFVSFYPVSTGSYKRLNFFSSKFAFCSEGKDFLRLLYQKILINHSSLSTEVADRQGLLHLKGTLNDWENLQEGFGRDKRGQYSINEEKKK